MENVNREIRKEPADNMALVRNKGRRLNEYVKDYIVFDLETTGFRPGLDEIIGKR